MADPPKFTRPKLIIKPLEKPLQFGKPEKRNWLGLVLFAVFLAISIYAVAWMIRNYSPMGSLVCDTGGTTSLTGFGRCHDVQGDVP